MSTIYIIDLLGTLVFAMSGVLAASEHRLDLFGATILGFVTAVGGGTLRDMLLGYTPVGWMRDVNYLYVILLGIIIALIFNTRIFRFRKTIFLFDAIGIGLFTILGIDRTLSYDLPFGTALIMGTVSAVFGGVLRDVLANEVPLIFRKDFYAMVCILGGVAYLSMLRFGIRNDMAMIVAVIMIIVLRVLAVKFRWRLPQYR